MHRKAVHRQKPNKVEDIYGVHFKYQDLFSRLLKVQKQRQLSEDKPVLPRIPSVDLTHLRHFSIGKEKIESLLPKNQIKSESLVKKTQKRSVSIKKIVTRHPVTDRKQGIFKSFSPTQHKSHKTLSQTKPAKKKGSSTIKITKKTHINRKV